MHLVELIVAALVARTVASIDIKEVYFGLKVIAYHLVVEDEENEYPLVQLSAVESNLSQSIRSQR